MAADMHGDITCPLPDCASPLHLIYKAGLCLTTGDLTKGRDLRPADTSTTTWQVECEDGHVLLLPGPTGCPGDNDDCTAHPADDYDWSDDYRSFRAHDTRRLHDLIKQMAAAEGLAG